MVAQVFNLGSSSGAVIPFSVFRFLFSVIKMFNINKLATETPVNDEQVGGAGLRARQAVRTGWKACATGRTIRSAGDQ